MTIDLAARFPDHGFYAIGDRSPSLYKAFADALEASDERLQAASGRHHKLATLIRRYGNLVCEHDSVCLRAPIKNDPVVKILDGFMEPDANLPHRNHYAQVASELKGYVHRRTMDEKTYTSILNGTHYLFTHEPSILYDRNFGGYLFHGWIPKNSPSTDGEEAIEK